MVSGDSCSFHTGFVELRGNFYRFHFFLTGLMTDEEKDIWKSIPTKHPKYWVPCVWFTNLIRLARKQGRIQSDPALKTIVDVGIPFSYYCCIACTWL